MFGKDSWPRSFGAQARAAGNGGTGGEPRGFPRPGQGGVRELPRRSGKRLEAHEALCHGPSRPHDLCLRSLSLLRGAPSFSESSLRLCRGSDNRRPCGLVRSGGALQASSQPADSENSGNTAQQRQDRRCSRPFHQGELPFEGGPRRQDRLG